MPRFKHYVLITLCSLLFACSGSDNECSVYRQNKFVHELLLDRYLWYQQVPASISYHDFDSPEETLDFLKFHEKDRFSSITDAAEFDSLYQDGQYLGYGFSYIIKKDDGTVWLRFIYDDSPSGRAGLQRGDRILSINNQPVEQISASFGWQEIFGPDEEGYPVDMLVRKQDGSITDIHMQKTVVNINTVLHHSIINTGTGTVGYLVFNSFLSTSNHEFLQVFSEFNAAGIDRLILDLRYNRGGSVSVAKNLASYLHAVSENNTHLFSKLVFNDKHQDSNSFYYLATLIDALSLDKMIVITTGETASASEMIINGLRPYVDVTTVGSKSYGKPVGMSPVENCGKIILPITFEVRNRNDEGEYYDGIAADCPALDDVEFAFGNEQEPMLSEALYVSRYDSCTPLQSARRPPAYRSPEPVDYLQGIIGAH